MLFFVRLVRIGGDPSVGSASIELSAARIECGYDVESGIQSEGVLMGGLCGFHGGRAAINSDYYYWHWFGPFRCGVCAWPSFSLIWLRYVGYLECMGPVVALGGQIVVIGRCHVHTGRDLLRYFNAQVVQLLRFIRVVA